MTIGLTLEEIFQRSKIDSMQRLGQTMLTNWFVQAAQSLSVVHPSGMIHRDIKPSNLMVTDLAVGTDTIKLMDFGTARNQDHTRTMLTQTGQGLGTPVYMSPEQLRLSSAAGDLTEFTDLYSLCMIFYEIFTGKCLFEHDHHDLPPQLSEHQTANG